MSDLNNALLGVAARDRASMRGTSPEDRIAAMEDRIARLERALTYAMQLPREIIITSGSTITPVTWSEDGRIYLHSSSLTIDIERKPHARQHVIDLNVNTDAVCAYCYDIEQIKADLLSDLLWLDEICAYCDTGTPPDPWPT